MRTRTYVMFGALTLSASAGAQIQRAHAIALTAQQVTRIIDERLADEGVSIPGAHVQLLSHVVSSSEQPDLHVTSIELLNSTQATRKDQSEGLVPRYAVRLACSSTRECLPFYAVVSTPAAMNVPVRPLPPQPSAKVTHSAAVKAPAVLKAPAVVKAGDHATVVMNGRDAHIELSVTCLEDGSEGQMIRVSNPMNKQTFQAQVVREGLLKGAF